MAYESITDIQIEEHFKDFSERYGAIDTFTAPRHQYRITVFGFELIRKYPEFDISPQPYQLDTIIAGCKEEIKACFTDQQPGFEIRFVNPNSVGVPKFSYFVKETATAEPVEEGSITVGIDGALIVKSRTIDHYENAMEFVKRFKKS